MQKNILLILLIIMLCEVYAEDNINLSIGPATIKVIDNKIYLEGPSKDIYECGSLEACYKDMCKLYNDNYFGTVILSDEPNLTMNGIDNRNNIKMVITPAEYIGWSIYRPMFDDITVCTGLVDCFTSIIYVFDTYPAGGDMGVFVKILHGC
ncbi:MAG: hypothetical protein Satyrvirus28_9 [Satyrvirus sp.]|uniref:Uncharacterized protein n=1 Tax=Satyrvirus sp. TaxID=2487771 RepID=A0A3G5AH72_9VIRU|nr:MAG: hypothetical protein Satyrvirus28_9 [Satyrvirus sp.]